MKALSSKKDIHFFLGMVGYYRRFIPGFAKIANPLFYLLKYEAKFIWTNECQRAFDKLKSKLITAPVLNYLDFEKKFAFILMQV